MSRFLRRRVLLEGDACFFDICIAILLIPWSPLLFCCFRARAVSALGYGFGLPGWAGLL